MIFLKFVVCNFFIVQMIFYWEELFELKKKVI